MVTAAYLRVSDKDGDQDTISNQRPKVEEFCKARGFQIFEYYEDDDVSGTIPFDKRPEGSRLIRDARSGLFKCVVVFKTNRLGRDTRDILNVVHDLKEMGVGVVSTTEAFDTANPAGKLMFEMLASFSAYERENILQITKAGIMRSAREDAYLGGIVAYGYRVEGERRAARYVLNTEIMECGMSEVQVVQWIYHHLVNEKGSTYSAALRLNALGVPTRYKRGGFVNKREDRAEPTGEWSPSAIYNLVVKPLYKGEWLYQMKGEEPILRTVPAIVPTELWEKAQVVLKNNSRFCRRNGKRDYLLRSLMKCVHCERNFVGTCPKVNGRQYPIYRCTGKGCVAVGLNALKIENAVWEHLSQLLLNPEEVLSEVLRDMDAVQIDREALTAETLALRKEIDSKEGERTRVFSLFRRGRMTEAELDLQLEEIKEEELGLHRRLQQVDEMLVSTEEKTRRLMEAAEGLSQYREYLREEVTAEEKRHLIQLLIQEIRVTTVEKISRKRNRVRVEVDYTFTREEAFGLGTDGRSQHKLTIAFDLAA